MCVCVCVCVCRFVLSAIRSLLFPFASRQSSARAEDARDAGYLLQPPLPCKSSIRPPDGADRRASRAHTSKCAPGHARWHVVAADARRRQRAGNVDAKGVGCIWCDAYPPD